MVSWKVVRMVCLTKSYALKHGVGLAEIGATLQNRAGAWSVLDILGANDDPRVVFGRLERWRVERPQNSVRNRPSRCFWCLGALARAASREFCLESTTLSLYPWPPSKTFWTGSTLRRRGRAVESWQKPLGGDKCWKQQLGWEVLRRKVHVPAFGGLPAWIKHGRCA